MYGKIGFQTSGTPNENEPLAAMQPEPQQPVRCIAYVRFDGVHKAYAYYNDRFQLQEGDTVFVSGKLAGKPGMVESVQTHFKIRLSDYERVISKAEGGLRGHFEAVRDKMICDDPDVLPPEMFRTWVLPPVENEEDILLGEGFRTSLFGFGDDEELPRSVLQKGMEMAKEGRVVYLHLKNSIGTAFLSGDVWREVNFTLSNGEVGDLYCDCPYPENGMCKHMAAVLVALCALYHTERMKNADRFVALDRNWFWDSVSGREEVNL